MRVHSNFRGIHTATAQLASGEKVTYYYAWRGGPRLVGEPGSPEFSASYQTAIQNKRCPSPMLFRSILGEYQGSLEFEKLRPRTQADYRRQLGRIEAAFGDLPIDALNDPRMSRELLDWRATLAESARQADYAWTVLKLVLSWARARGIISYRPPERVPHLYRADRADKVWSDEDIAAFMAVAPATLRLALMLALETGQRQGDLLRLPWSAIEGHVIRLRQSKSGRLVAIPMTKQLRVALDEAPRSGPLILTHTYGRPWQPNAFRAAWGKASRKAGIVDRTFHDLRGTAVTRLTEVGCTPQEIATITGHGLRDVGAIMDRYSARTEKIASAAIAKLEQSRG